MYKIITVNFENLDEAIAHCGKLNRMSYEDGKHYAVIQFVSPVKLFGRLTIKKGTAKIAITDKY